MPGETRTLDARPGSETKRSLAGLLEDVAHERDDCHRASFWWNTFALVGLVGGTALAFLAGFSALADLVGKNVVGLLAVASGLVTAVVTGVRPGQRHLFHLHMFNKVTSIHSDILSFRAGPSDTKIEVSPEEYEDLAKRFTAYKEECYKTFSKLDKAN